MSQLIVGQGTDRLYSDDLTQGFAGGPRVGLTYHADNGYDWEFSFFQIDGWNNARSIASSTSRPAVASRRYSRRPATSCKRPTTGPRTWDGSMRRSFTMRRSTSLDLCSRVTMLAGLRWVNLWEELQGTSPSERSAPFWDTKTRNNLYGLQLGEDWRIFNRGPFSIDGLVKAGIFDNVADEATGVSIYRVVYGETASTNHAAFLGEIGLQCKYQVLKGLVLKAGYEAIWLQGVAYAARSGNP